MNNAEVRKTLDFQLWLVDLGKSLCMICLLSGSMHPLSSALNQCPNFGSVPLQTQNAHSHSQGTLWNTIESSESTPPLRVRGTFL